MRHLRKLLVVTAVCLGIGGVFLSGCGEQEQVYVPIVSNTLEVNEAGNLIAYIVEDFDKDYYDINELKTMVETEIAAYNEKNAGLAEGAGRAPIIVDKVMMAEDGSKKAVVALNFNNSLVYEDYMQEEIFFGTVAEAMAEGYDLAGVMKSVKKGEALTGEKLQKAGNQQILIVGDAVTVRTYSAVQYLSDNAVLTTNGYVDATTADSLKYMIVK